MAREGNALEEWIHLLAARLAVTAVSASVLTTDTDVPVVTETAVNASTLEALEVVTELGVNHVGNNLEVLTSVTVLLTVEEPSGDVEVLRGLDDGLESLNLSLRELTSTVNYGKKQYNK